MNIEESLNQAPPRRPARPLTEASLLQLVTAFRASKAIYAAASLGIADLLAQQPMSETELAKVLNANPAGMRRLMRALSALGVFQDGGVNGFRLAPMGHYLRRDVPGSLHSAVLFLAGETSWRLWGDLDYSVHNGGDAFNHLFGMEAFEYWASHPEECKLRDQAMETSSALAAAPLLAIYDFSRFHQMVDLGGGTGRLLAEILIANPQMEGILFDLPHVVVDAEAILRQCGVEDRCQIRSGNFFEAVPAGADAYLLKYIIHNWDDERAKQIFMNCRKAAKPDSVLLVIDSILPERAEPGASAAGFFVDLEMLVRMPGGRERTGSELNALLASAGFSVGRTTSINSLVSVVESHPA